MDGTPQLEIVLREIINRAHQVQVHAAEKITVPGPQAGSGGFGTVSLFVGAVQFDFCFMVGGLRAACPS